MWSKLLINPKGTCRTVEACWFVEQLRDCKLHAIGARPIKESCATKTTLELLYDAPFAPVHV